MAKKPQSRDAGWPSAEPLEHSELVLERDSTPPRGRSPLWVSVVVAGSAGKIELAAARKSADEVAVSSAEVRRS